MRLLAVLPVLLLAGAADAQLPYRASGTEPFWSLTIGRQQTRLEEVGRRDIVVLSPREQKTRHGRRFVSRAIAIEIVRRPCSDGMSDRRYPETVTVTIGGRRLRGCGGLPPVAETRLAESHWTIATIDGRPIGPRLRPTVDFTANRVEGKVCNRFGADYRLERDRLTAGPVVATRMACIGPMQPVETSFFKVMAEPVRLTWQGDDRLELRNARGSVGLQRTR